MENNIQVRQSKSSRRFYILGKFSRISEIAKVAPNIKLELMIHIGIN